VNKKVSVTAPALLKAVTVISCAPGVVQVYDAVSVRPPVRMIGPWSLARQL
jgi:hypothetical protein